MTPIYSKETAEDYIDAANGSGNDNPQLWYGPVFHEVRTINRLISNGNEVMGVLTSVEQVLKNEGYAGMSIVVSDLIKKIRGEI